MEINKWIESYKVRILPWIDGKRIYCNVQYFESGASVEKPPTWDKSVYIKDCEMGRKLAYGLTDSLVRHIAQMTIPQEAEVTINF